MTGRGGNRRNGQTTEGREAPHNLEAEESLLGAALLRKAAPDKVDQALALIDEADFYSWTHRHIYTAVQAVLEAGEDPNPVNVHNRLQQQGHTDLASVADLTALQGKAPSSGAPSYARIIKEHANRRRLIGLAADLAQAGYNGTDPAPLLEQLHHLDTVTAAPIEPGPTIDAFLDADEPEYDWIVPGLLERGDRVILTGNEGDGKSTALRQMTVQMAAGIHPFTLDDIAPVRVLYIDLENSSRQVRRKLRPLRLAAAKLDPDNVTVKVRPQGLDLLHRDDAARLDGYCAANRPDVLIIGPLYKMASGDPTEEKVAKAVTDTLDHLRTKHQFAVIIEAHTPHSTTNTGRRPERPYGASLWLRWPEFGIYLAKEGNLRPWRGARDERDWPVLLTRGGEWPWTVEHDRNAVTFARCLEEAQAAGSRLSVRELADRIGASKSQIQRTLDANRAQWETTCRNLETGDPYDDTQLFSDHPDPTGDDLDRRRQDREAKT